jgi:stress response protein YsnF
VVEEVVVGRESSQRTETVHDTVRGTEVEVERDTSNAATGGTDPLNKKPL